MSFLDVRPEFTIKWNQLHSTVIRADDLKDAERMLGGICKAYVDARPHSIEKVVKP